MTWSQTVVCGFVGGEISLKPNAQSASNMAFFTVATNTSRQNETGEWEKETEWHSIVCFGRLADQAKQYLSKGMRVLVVGRNRTRKWTGKDGIDRYKTEIVANTLEFMFGTNHANQQSSNTYGQTQSYGHPVSGAYASTTPATNPEDCPF